MTAVVKSRAFDCAFDEIVANEVCTPDIESAKLRAGRFALGSEDATGFNFVGFAEELDEYRHTIDIARPSEARFALLKLRLLQIVLQRPVRLGCLIAECKADDEIDVGRTHMSAGTFGEFPDEVSRCQAASQIDPVFPWPEIAKERDQHALAA